MGRFRLPWVRRRPRVRMTPFDRSRLPDVTPASFEEMLEEGLLMAESAARMALKNRLIVDALRGDELYSDARAAERARGVLYELVTAGGRRGGRARRRGARGRGEARGRSQHQHDYHRDDLLNLRRREKVHAAIAKELWTRRSDDEFVARLVERARDDAWDQLGRVIEQELDRRWPRFDEEPDYADHRSERMADVGDDLSRDLARLEAQRAVEGPRVLTARCGIRHTGRMTRNWTPLAVVYVVLAVAGLVGTWTYNAIAIARGDDFIGDLVSSGPAVSSITTDLLVVAVAGSILIAFESKRLGMRFAWAYILGSALTAFAFTFPIWLAMRERRLAARRADDAAASVAT